MTWAATSAMRRVLHEGHTPRPLQEYDPDEVFATHTVRSELDGSPRSGRGPSQSVVLGRNTAPLSETAFALQNVTRESPL